MGGISLSGDHTPEAHTAGKEKYISSAEYQPVGTENCWRATDSEKSVEGEPQGPQAQKAGKGQQM